MEKLFNWFSVAWALLGGFLVRSLGGYDVVLRAIIWLVALDYISGIIKAFYLKKLSSEIGFKGILKKATIFIVIALAVVLQGLIGGAVAIREIVIMFFICNEALSLLENAAVLIPIPDALKNVLLQLREKTENNNQEGDGAE